MNSLRKLFVENQFEQLEKEENGSVEDLTIASDVSDTTEYQYFTCRCVRAKFISEFWETKFFLILIFGSYRVN